jgi:hypothetical protein
MVKISNIIDYLIFIPLIGSVIFLILGHNKYEGILVYFSTIIFLGYWMLKIIFSPKFKENLS